MSEYDDQSLISLLDDIAQNLKDAKSRFFGSTSVVVNRDYLLDLVYSAREIVPDQLSQADEILAKAGEVKDEAEADAEDIREKARGDAEGIIAEAREQASRLVAKDAVTIAAKAEASRIVDAAKAHAEKLRRGADDYSDQTLAKLEQDVSSVDGAIADVLATLRSRFDAISEQIDSGRAVIAERSEQRTGLRPSSSAFGAKEDAGDEEVTLVGPVPPELQDEPEDMSETAELAADNLPEAPLFGETAPEPADGEYR